MQDIPYVYVTNSQFRELHEAILNLKNCFPHHYEVWFDHRLPGKVSTDAAISRVFAAAIKANIISEK